MNAAVAVGVGVNVAVAVAVAVGVSVGVGVNVAVGVDVGVGEGEPQGPNSCTSSKYIPVSSPKPSWCTRNLMRTVCPANGAMFTCVLIHVWPFEH